MAKDHYKLEAIEQAALDPVGQRVLLKTTSSVGLVDLELSIDLLQRLVALGLHALGQNELSNGEELSALLPEGLEICGFPDKRVGLRFILPGGAPLTFLLDPIDAQQLGTGLIDHVRNQNFDRATSLGRAN